MIDRDGLLRAIRESPEDDTPRLVYADWLEDRGDVGWAELIRVQCELARLDRDDPRRYPLEQRAWGLVQTHRDRWQAELPTLKGICLWAAIPSRIREPGCSPTQAL